MSSSKKEHDPLETVVRFVCGALAGGLVGFYMGFRWKLSGFLPMLAITMGFCRGRVIIHFAPALAPACGWMREARRSP